jgi:two-component system, NarL family, sensor histidine kinase DesK
MDERTGYRIGTAFALAWLIMLAFQIEQVAAGARGHEAEAGTVIAALLAFAAIYTWFWVRVVGRDDSPAGTLIAVGGMLAINLTLMVAYRADRGASQGLSYNFIYVVVAAAMGLRWKAGVVACVLVAALTFGLGVVLWPSDIGSSLGTTVLVLLIGMGMVSVGQMVSTITELHRAREEMARLAVGEERLRFARDLHDLLGQSLSVIVLKSEVARGLLEHDPVQAGEAVSDIERVARGALRDVREAVAGYRKTNLAGELAGAREMLESAGISVRWDESAGDLPEEAETVLAWAVREGATNVLRHSRAREWMIKLERRNGSAVLEMVDDGAATAGGVGAELGNGLRGLGERVAAVGGEMKAQPVNGHGFRLAVRVPVSAVPAPPGPSPA